MLVSCTTTSFGFLVYSWGEENEKKVETFWKGLHNKANSQRNACQRLSAPLPPN
jgi:hypothetical protein